jgi:hypothetical protein
VAGLQQQLQPENMLTPQALAGALDLTFRNSDI